MFSKKTLDGYFYTTKGFYIFFIPIGVPYKKIYSLADGAGLKKKAEFGPILEKGSLFGKGWIGVEIEQPREQLADVVHVAASLKSGTVRCSPVFVVSRIIPVF
jgi:hypothetical protein